MKREDFAYSIGLIRTLETLLLNTNEMERMILEKNAHEAFKILDELDYADNTAGIDNPAEFQTVIKEGLMDIKILLEKVSPDKRILNIVLFQYDIHNIKTMLKAKLSGKNFEDIKEMLSELGAIKLSALQIFIFEGTNVSFTLDEPTEAKIKDLIKTAEKMFTDSNGNPQIIDLYLDENLIDLIYEIAEYTKSEFLITYVKKLIDLSNIRLFFRMKIQEKNSELLEMALNDKGTINKRKFISAYTQKLDEFSEIMQSTNYGQLVETGLKHFEQEKTLIYLEKEIENHLTSYIKRATHCILPREEKQCIDYQNDYDQQIKWSCARRNKGQIKRNLRIN
jgi:V/A-type H+-transporting ATPase subunit C